MRHSPLAVLALTVLPLLAAHSARADGPAPAASAPSAPAEHGSLGFQAVPVAAIPPQALAQLGIPADAGVVAVNVLPGGAGDAAGLKLGDVLLKIAGHEMPATKDVDPVKPATLDAFSAAFKKLVGDTPVGAKVEIVVQRDGKPVTLTATAAAERGYIGFQPTPAALLNAKQRTHFNVKADKGVVAVLVRKGSPAEKAGLQNGDVLLKYAGQDVPATKTVDATKPESGKAFSDAFAKIAATTRPGTEMEIVVERDGKPVTLKAIPVDFEGMQKFSAGEDEEDEGDEGNEGPEKGEGGEKAPEKAPAPK